MNIALCGMMGCGKTTVAAALNGKYGYTVVDTDAEIVAMHGEINAIFRDFGEQRFRDIESEVTAAAAQRDGIVISLGGGCVLRQRNVDALKEHGKIFYLRTRAETIISRIKGDKSRPLLQGDLEKKVHSILESRADIYEAAADYIVDTDGRTPEQIADEIVALSGN